MAVKYDMNNRIIIVTDYLDDKICDDMLLALTVMINEDNKNIETIKDFKPNPIHMYISSPGGFVYPVWGIINLMIESKTPIYTYNVGMCDSMAFQLFLAGDKRFASKYTRFCYHQIKFTYNSNYQNVVESQDYLDYSQNNLEEYIMDRTLIDYETLIDVRLYKKDWVIKPDEAIKLGIVTDIEGVNYAKNKKKKKEK